MTFDSNDIEEIDYERLPWGAWGRSWTLGSVCLCSKFVMKVLNSTVVENRNGFLKAVMERDRTIGLITVSNHTSTIDDPTLHCALLPLKFFFKEHRHQSTRWVTCAEEMCYRNAFLKQFFMSGKTLPVKRGSGVHQPVMSRLSDFVRRGDWVHIFPEGRVNYSGKVGHLKWGVGKVICDSLQEDGTPPIVLPFYHSGMGNVMPRKSRIPRHGETVRITIGEPMDLNPWTCRCGSQEKEKVWAEITNEIEKALKALEKISVQNPSQLDDKTKS